MFGIDGVIIGLIITFVCLFAGILSGFPVAFGIGGAGIVSFGILAVLDSYGLMVHSVIDTSSLQYKELIAQGVSRVDISVFRYPELPVIQQALFPGGWEKAMTRNISFVVNRINERVIAGQSIETLLAVLMFVLMGITLERSKIAGELLTTMARVFGHLPGGLAVSVVVVGAFLAASTGIVGATVVTMGLLSLPTMLRNKYSPELATGVISASGTLGQIIPPSIVIIILGTLAGDIYSTAQETRAQSVGCFDALTYLGSPAVVSIGTLFKAALLPGIMLAFLYAAYAFIYALLNPNKAPAVTFGDISAEKITLSHGLRWFLLFPTILLAFLIGMFSLNIVGSQNITVDTFTDITQTASLRTDVSDKCKNAMIDLHGQDAWDKAVEERKLIEQDGGAQESRKLTEEEYAAALTDKISGTSPLGIGVSLFSLFVLITFSISKGISPSSSNIPSIFGLFGIILSIIFDYFFIKPTTSPGLTVIILLIPWLITFYGLRFAVLNLSKNELLRVVFPPLILIIAVLGSILGGITNPTPAAALGAGGALLLAAFRHLKEEDRSAKIVLYSSFSIIICILLGVNFDLRINTESVSFETWTAFLLAYGAYLYALFGLLYSCLILYNGQILTPVVRETAKVTSMVFTILIGSQVLNLVVISFGGEHYIQQFLRSYDSELVIFLIVMLILFILGFVLDFLEIIYIVVPIVGPVIYGGSFDPSWVTIMIAINLQTSFLTPPFGFALFYLRGVAPRSVTTAQIYRGVIPFVIIQIVGLIILWYFPDIVTIVPQLLPNTY